jgi:hypothetical protein
MPGSGANARRAEKRAAAPWQAAPWQAAPPPKKGKFQAPRTSSDRELVCSIRFRLVFECRPSGYCFQHELL